MADRDAKLATVRMSGTLLLEESADKSVLLEAVLVLDASPVAGAPDAPPKLRLQAKKLGHTAFDLTMNADGVFLLDGREKQEKDPEATRHAEAGFAALPRALARFGGGRAFAGAKTLREDAASFTVALSKNGDDGATATLHKAALVPLSFDFRTPKGPVHLRLEHAPVADAAGTVFPLPCKLAAETPDGHKFAFEAKKLEANPALNPAVFTPPKAARRLTP